MCRCVLGVPLRAPALPAQPVSGEGFGRGAEPPSEHRAQAADQLLNREGHIMRKQASVETTAEAYLELLAARGVEYMFANAGTDFAPIIEAYARRGAQGQARPRP